LLDRCCEAGREIRSLASIRDELLPQLLRVEGPTLLPRYSWDSHP
jgi:hypothetical protein